MPFLAPVVAGALGLGAIGTAVVQLGIGVGLSLLATKLTARKAGGSSPQGARLSLQVDPSAERQVIFGRQATAGSLVFWNLSGADNKTLHMVIALADHECDGLESAIWVNGRLQSWNSGTGVVSGYGGKLKVRFYPGTLTQTADATLVAASGGRWTANDRGLGVCYAVVEADYDPDVFPQGIPSIVFVVRGAKLYDARKDSTAGGSGAHRFATPSTWEYSANPAVIAYNIIRGVTIGGVPLLGLKAAAGAIRYDDFAAAANACDENVALAAGGTEKRYLCNTIVGSTADNRATLERVLSSMAGQIVEAGGIYRIQAGVAQPSVASLTDADLIVDRPLTVEPRLPRSQLVNTVLGTYTDPSNQYVEAPLPVRTSSADVTEDGGVRLATALDLTSVTSRTQAQRVMEIERKRARRMMIVSCTLRSRWCTLEAGDWITITSARRGWTSRVFEIEAASVNEDLTIDVTLRETDSGVDDWTTADEIANAEVIDLGSAGPATTAISGFALAHVLINSGGAASRPGLAATWTAITDPTVTDVEIEYRRVGDTIAQTVRTTDPASGSYVWAAGVQGGTRYEARARMLTAPARATDWTAWTSAATDTAPVKVNLAVRSDTAALAEGLTVNAIDSLNIRIDEAVAEALGESADMAAYAQEAVAKYAGNWGVAVTDAGEVTGVVSLSGTDGVPVLYNVNTTAGSTAATMISTRGIKVGSTITGNAAIPAGTKVTAINANGKNFTLSAPATATATSSPTVFRLPGVPNTSRFAVIASEFFVSQPGQAGGTAKPVFAIRKVNGVNTLALAGDIIADNSITAKHLEVGILRALFASFGDVTISGTMRSEPTVYSRNVSSTSGSTTAGMNTTAGVKIGDVVRNHPRIPDGTTVTAILSGTTVQLNRAATGTQAAIATRMESPGKLFVNWRTGQIRALA